MYNYMHKKDAFIFVYDTNSESSFTILQKIANQLKLNEEFNRPKLLIGVQVNEARKISK
jgi:GTPase SAR1 family protein